MPQGEAECFRRRLERAEARFGSLELKIKVHLVLQLADELVHHSRILDAVEDIIGPNILAWDADFIIKNKEDPRYVSWHQDLTYWGLEPNEVVTAWVALSPSTVQSGCMRVMPASHEGGIAAHHDTFARDNLLTRGQEVTVEVDESRAVDIVLQPGQMSLHDGKLIHGSRPNRSEDRRIGFAIRYIPTSVRQVAGDKDSAMLVRGVDGFGNFEMEPRPQGDFEPSQIAVQSAIAARRSAVLYRGTDRGLQR
jgi:ectoine hydroxylase-related dioxygenase (phytanoyl-CoA dioxygenase family)